MAVAGQDQGVRFSVLIHITGQSDVVGAPLRVIAQQFPSHRQHAAEHGDKTAAGQPQRPPGQRAEPAEPIHQQIGHQNAPQQMPDKQQLVVVVRVGLKHHNLGQRQDGQPAAVEPALLRRGVEKGGKEQQIDKTDVLDVKPEIVVLQRAVIAAVDPVEMQPQHILPVQGLGKDSAPHLCQPDHTAHRRQQNPGQQHLPRAGTAEQRVDSAHQADQDQRQGGMGVHQRQGKHQRGQRQPEPRRFLHAEPPQKIQSGEQYAPPEQRCPLGNQQIHNGIDPQDVPAGVIGGRGIKPGKNSGKIRCAAQKINKPQPTAHKEEPESQTGLSRTVQKPAGQLPCHAVNAEERGQHGQQISGFQPGPQHHKHAGNRLAQKRVPKPVPAAQQGIVRREFSRHRNVFDESQMHRHIAVAALPGVIGAVHQMEHMGVKQRQRQKAHRNQAGPHGRAVWVGFKAAPGTGAHQPNPQCGDQNSRQENRRRAKSQDNRQRRRNQGQQGNAEPASQRDQHRGALLRQGAPCRRQPDGQKQRQITHTHNSCHGIQIPSRSKGGVYSSRALLFSCIYPSVSPSSTAALTTLRYS